MLSDTCTVQVLTRNTADSCRIEKNDDDVHSKLLVQMTHLTIGQVICTPARKFRAFLFLIISHSNVSSVAEMDWIALISTTASIGCSGFTFASILKKNVL